MADVSLDDLSPVLASIYPSWVNACADAFSAQGLTGTVKIIQGWRDPAYQDQLHVQGISPLTGAQSQHCCMEGAKPASRAFDFGVFDGENGYVTNGQDPRYILAGEVAKNLGLVYGGDFVHPGPDWDHIELPRSAQ